MSVLNLLMSARKAFADWQRAGKRAYAELMALDDHSLADIGIQRSQVRDLCDGFLRARSLGGPLCRSADGENSPRLELSGSRGLPQDQSRPSVDN